MKGTEILSKSSLLENSLLKDDSLQGLETDYCLPEQTESEFWPMVN